MLLRCHTGFDSQLFLEVKTLRGCLQGLSALGASTQLKQRLAKALLPRSELYVSPFRLRHDLQLMKSLAHRKAFCRVPGWPSGKRRSRCWAQFEGPFGRFGSHEDDLLPAGDGLGG